jgi:hypothetical protein
VTDLRPRPLSVVRVEATSPHFRTRLGERAEDALGRRQQLVHLEIADTLPPGKHDEQVVLFTDDPDYRELRVAVSVVRRGVKRVSVLPNSVEVVASAQEPAPRRLLTVRGAKGEPVVIDRVEADDPAVACTCTGDGGVTQNVAVTIDPSKARHEPIEAKVRIHIRQPVVEVIEVPVRCDVRRQRD